MDQFAKWILIVGKIVCIDLHVTMQLSVGMFEKRFSVLLNGKDFSN